MTDTPESKSPQTFGEFRKLADDLAAKGVEVDTEAVKTLRRQWDKVKAGYRLSYQQIIEDRLTLAERYSKTADTNESQEKP